MNVHVVIRASSEKDVPHLAAIYIASVEAESASWEYVPPSVEEFALRRRNLLAQGFPYLTAELDGTVVGYSHASAYRSRIGYRFVIEDSVYVLHTRKGRGIGRQLLTALIDECVRRGYRQMVAVIGDSANAASIKMHETCGFEKVAVFKCIGYKFDRWLDSVQMQRALGHGSATAPAANQ